MAIFHSYVNVYQRVIGNMMIFHGIWDLFQNFRPIPYVETPIKKAKCPESGVLGYAPKLQCLKDTWLMMVNIWLMYGYYMVNDG
jgi:hypothetical protein